MSHIDKGMVNKLVNYIIEKHQETKSYRKVASKYFPSIIKAGTLNRIAKSKGKWIPKSKKILIALGLIDKVEMPQWMKTWRHLKTEERHKVIQEYLKWKNKNS